MLDANLSTLAQYVPVMAIPVVAAWMKFRLHSVRLSNARTQRLYALSAADRWKNSTPMQRHLAIAPVFGAMSDRDIRYGFGRDNPTDFFVTRRWARYMVELNADETAYQDARRDWLRKLPFKDWEGALVFTTPVAFVTLLFHALLVWDTSWIANVFMMTNAVAVPILMILFATTFGSAQRLLDATNFPPAGQREGEAPGPRSERRPSSKSSGVPRPQKRTGTRSGASAKKRQGDGQASKLPEAPPLHRVNGSA